MAIICRSLRLIFVHIPKTGGTSVRALLRRFDAEPRPGGLRKHEPLWRIRERFEEDCAAFTTFSVVRNPWDRAVSLHFFRVRRLQSGAKAWPAQWPSREDIARLSFRDIVLRSTEQDPIKREICPPRLSGETTWLAPSCLSWLTLDGALGVDRVCRFESLAEEIGRLGASLGADFSGLPRLNASARGAYRDHYDDETREIVAERYRNDIETFGYTF